MNFTDWRKDNIVPLYFSEHDQVSTSRHQVASPHDRYSIPFPLTLKP